MALPATPANRWIGDLDGPLKLLRETAGDYEMYEEDDEFVLAIEMPGFERDDIVVSWDQGVLNVAAEHIDEQRGREKTYHRRFRFPKGVEDDEITARYTNGVLEVKLPLQEEATVTGKRIPVES